VPIATYLKDIQDAMLECGMEVPDEKPPFLDALFDAWFRPDGDDAKVMELLEKLPWQVQAAVVEYFWAFERGEFDEEVKAHEAFLKKSC